MAREILTPNLWSIESLFKNVFYVPVYQRPYSWDKEQIDMLLKDIFDSYKSKNKADGYYVGNIIIYDKNNKINGQVNSYDVVDGQQRITTFALILLSIYTLSCSRKVKSNDTTMISIKNAIWIYFERTNHKDILSISLNSIEKDCFKELFDYAYENPENIISYCSKYNSKNNFEKRIIDNFINIYNSINNKISNNEELLLFAEYILTNIKVISIEANCDEHAVFSMFESINSKGKKLEEIDLIKTYIFSQLSPDLYKDYLKIWGNLIIETHDQLYDYLFVYIKAFIKFYRQNINVQNFKVLVEKDMSEYYHSKDISNTVRCFLDDLKEYVVFYKMLNSINEIDRLISTSKFKFYYLIYLRMEYVHPKPLFLRMFIEYKNNNINQKMVENITKEIVEIMLKFLTIAGRDSKDIISMFSNIMNEIYVENSIDDKMILYYISNQLLEQSLNNEQLFLILQGMDCYYSQKKLGSIILALYEATEKKSDGTYKTFYDKSLTLLDKYGSSLSLDHLMVRNPEKEDTKYSFYEENGLLVLKDNNDFPKELVQNGMNYSLFIKQILNRIGNLQYCYRDINSSQGNGEKLFELKHQYSFDELTNRTKEIFNVVFNNCLSEIEIDINKIKLTQTGKKIITYLPKMDSLIESGIISIGDKVYIKGHEEDSIATLLDDKYVNFNGDKMTLNEWGLKITNWKSICIYRHVIRVGDTETLHEKREKLLK